jgi:hypothetical protein
VLDDGDFVKFNPITKNLFTDNNVLIKKINCSFSICWSGLSLTKASGVRSCNLCEKNITDTNGLTDEVVAEMVRLDANSCLKVNLNQANITVANQDV